MSSSSLANWDGSQTPKKPQETPFNSQEFRSPTVAAIAVAIGSQAGTKAADISSPHVSASYYQLEPGSSGSDRTNGGVNVLSANEALTNRGNEGSENWSRRVDLQQLDEDTVMMSPQSTSRISPQRVPPTEGLIPMPEYAAGPSNTHSITVQRTYSKRTSKPTGSDTGVMPQMNNVAPPVTPPRTSSHASLLSPPIYASPTHKLTIGGPSRRATPASSESHYGSLFTPSGSPAPALPSSSRASPQPRPGGKQRMLFDYVAVPPFPSGYTKLDYRLWPRKRKLDSYYKPEDAAFLPKPKKHRVYDSDEEFVVTSSPKKKAATAAASTSASITVSKAKTKQPKAKKQARDPEDRPSAPVSAKGQSSKSVSTQSQKPHNLGPKIPPQPPKPSRTSEHRVFILPTVSKKAIDNMQSLHFVHTRFAKQEFGFSRGVVEPRARQENPKERRHCWEEWPMHDCVDFQNEPPSVGFWQEEDEVDEEDGDVIVVEAAVVEGPSTSWSAALSMQKLVPSGTEDRPGWSAPYAPRKHSPKRPNMSPPSKPTSSSRAYTAPKSPSRVYVASQSPDRAQAIAPPASTTPKQPSAKSLGKQKAKEHDQAESRSPTFTLPPTRSPTTSIKSPPVSTYEQGARQYFVNVFDSPVRLTSPHESVFKHAQSSELNLASHSNPNNDFTSDTLPITTPDGVSADSEELFSANAGLSQSHSTTLTSSHDDMLSRSGIDTIDTNDWSNAMRNDQIPFGDGTINPSLLGGYLQLDDFTDPPPLTLEKSPSPTRSIRPSSPSPSPTRSTLRSSPSLEPSATRSTPPLSPTRSPSPSQPLSPVSAPAQDNDHFELPGSPVVRPQRAHHAPSRLPRLLTQKERDSDDEDEVPLALMIPPDPIIKRSPIKKPKIKAKSVKNGTSRYSTENWPQQDYPDYCHQCRGKSMILKIFCACGKKYCVRCLTRRYQDNPVLPKDDEDFLCPVCRDNCNCDKCTVKRGETYISLRKGRPRPPGIRPEDFPDSSMYKPRIAKNLADDDDEDESADEDTPPPSSMAPIVITGPVQYFGAMYDMNGKRIGTTFSGTNTDYVVFQPLGVPMARRSARVFIGEVQACWRLEDDCLVEEEDPLSPLDRPNRLKQRLYIGDKRLLYKARKPPEPEVGQLNTDANSQNWHADDMGSPLTELDELEYLNGEDNGDSGNHEGESLQYPFSAQYPNTPIDSQALQNPNQDSGIEEGVASFPPLDDQATARAIALSFKACGWL